MDEVFSSGMEHDVRSALSLFEKNDDGVYTTRIRREYNIHKLPKSVAHSFEFVVPKEFELPKDGNIKVVLVALNKHV